MTDAHGEGCGCRAEETLSGGESLYPYIDREGVTGLNEAVRKTEELCTNSCYCIHGKSLMRFPTMSMSGTCCSLLCALLDSNDL